MPQTYEQERNQLLYLLHIARVAADTSYTHARTDCASDKITATEFVERSRLTSIRLAKRLNTLYTELDELDAHQRCPEGSMLSPPPATPISVIKPRAKAVQA